ncbi:SIMPL domain-containing protein, partial [Klebsiella pneumoniae]|nr:SIMPL domain-containing protein [Klebsiella pneumoniae]
MVAHAVHRTQLAVEACGQLDKLNGLLDGALKAGLNEIRSVSLGVAQPDAYKDKARKAAIDDAVHQ